MSWDESDWATFTPWTTLPVSCPACGDTYQSFVLLPLMDMPDVHGHQIECSNCHTTFRLMFAVEPGGKKVK